MNKRNAKITIDVLPENHRQSKKTDRALNTQSACSRTYPISPMLLETAEHLFEVANYEAQKNLFTGERFHRFVPIGITSYVNYLEAYINETVGSSIDYKVFMLEDYSEETLKNTDVTEEALNKKKLKAFYKYYGLSPADFKSHEEILLLSDLRHEIVHFFPYALSANQTRIKVKKVTDHLKLKIDPTDDWTLSLQMLSILSWSRASALNFIREIKMNFRNEKDKIEE